MSSSASASRNFVPRSVWLRCAHFFRSGEAAHFVKEDIDIIVPIGSHGWKQSLVKGRQTRCHVRFQGVRTQNSARFFSSRLNFSDAAFGRTCSRKRRMNSSVVSVIVR